MQHDGRLGLPRSEDARGHAFSDVTRLLRGKMNSRENKTMRISTLCMLGVTLAPAALCGHQASAAALTVRTPTPTVHVAPPAAAVHAPKVSIHDISVTKHFDKSSPTLHRYVVTGKHIKSGTITARDKTSDQPKES